MFVRLTAKELFSQAVYSPIAGGPAKILPIGGCGGAPICDYQIFLSLTQDMLLSKKQFNKDCPVLI